MYKFRIGGDMCTLVIKTTDNDTHNHKDTEKKKSHYMRHKEQIMNYAYYNHYKGYCTSIIKP